MECWSGEQREPGSPSVLRIAWRNSFRVDAVCGGLLKIASQPWALREILLGYNRNLLLVRLQQRIETSLAEMMVGCESILDGQLVHQGKANTISEGPLFIVMKGEQVSRRLEPVGVNPL